jgi:divalent metal cation (Fe/Co/Zn/Cd) transporter
MKMVSVALTVDECILRRIHRIQIVTIIWMSVEAGASLAAAWTAHSPALIAFGGDSAIELFSAVIVLWAFSRRLRNHPETLLNRIAGILLLALAGYVALVSAMSLLGNNEPKPSYVGIGILIAAAVIMLCLAREKRKLSATIGSAVLRADAAQSGICAYLSVIALIGLVTNAIWHVSWADPVAALALTPLIVWEGKETVRGKPCRSC